ncbi:hypothetical protein [Streptomyces afghaniensis]|uniref:hypothetical protein n=1 Tax=Streptomyces afghaniensis TaxID=66865 RepID=UPI002781D240|nr:hypothetical protein [Streptomyces afghaniensis]
MTDRRADLVKERTRKTNRLHTQLLSIFSALEHAVGFETCIHWPVDLTLYNPKHEVLGTLT